MSRKLAALLIALIGVVVSACGGRTNGGTAGSLPENVVVLPPIDND
ncbi:MAG: hypothetical protein JO104_10380, partial [Candidatus Eremiobacteraeota bacterium]|nr:hypothetical protein [Candidatus Eremiobacteraeota bacterium]